MNHEMMETTMKTISPVQLVMSTLRDESMRATGHSWTRLNSVLRCTMHNLIIGGVEFEADDIAESLSGRGAGYWANTEVWYSSACGIDRSDGGGNRSAAISIENYLGRDPFLWAERTKEPERLCIGSTFTWKGERVTVTSFDDAKKTLTACSYASDDYDWNDNGQVGGTISFKEGNRVIEARVDYGDGTVAMRLSAAIKREGRKVKKRFCISNDEMRAVRADYEARRRKHEKTIKAATTLDELDAAQKDAADEGQCAYRHFDLEILNDLIRSKREKLTENLSAEEIERRKRDRAEAEMANWLAGGNARPYFSGIIRLRIKGDFVECSNGNKVSVEAALKTLPLVHRCREKGWERNGQVHDIDAFRLERIDKSGVKIGCTLITWDEVDRFTPILKAARKSAAGK